MNTILDKFYSNGKTSTNLIGQFGTLSSMIHTNNPYYKTSMSQVINPATHDNINRNGLLSATQPHPFNQPRPDITNRNTFQATGKSMFIPTASNIVNPSPFPKEFYKTNQEIACEEKKNSTKLQMMEEKMKGLELKSQRLEVINDFFFDMFENNIKGQLKTNQQEIDGEIEEEESNEEDEEEESEENNNHNKKHQKKRKGYNKKNKSAHLKPETKVIEPVKPVFDVKEFQKKTLQNAAKIMKNLKKIEEQLKKNEEMQCITEEIFEIKSDLQNKMRRIQQKQRVQMEGLAYILQNAGNPKIEAIAQRILSSNYYDFDGGNMGSPSRKDDDNGSVASYKRASVLGSIKRGTKGNIMINPRASALAKSPFRTNVGMISEDVEYSPKGDKAINATPNSKKIMSPRKSVSPKKNRLGKSPARQSITRFSKLG